MLSRKEIERAIRECEDGNSSYQNCEKLATLYTIYDHLYTTASPTITTLEETIIGDYGMSEFLSAIRGKDAYHVWSVIDELMDALKVTNPRLYDGVMRKMAE